MSAEPISGAEIVIKALVDQGVDVVFGYPGGAVLPIYDALFKQNALRHILVRHEGGAVHAAEGYARSTGRVGVVLVTSGPGATNAVTGLTDALMDSVPVVCLTGQVPTHLIGNDAFQEADTTGITRPCTKHNYLVKDVARTGAHDARGVLRRQKRPAGAGGDRSAKGRAVRARPLQQARGRRATRATARRWSPEPARIAEAVEMIAAAKRPLFYGGGGLINSGPEACAALYRDGAADRRALHLDPDGARRVPGRRPAFSRHGRHARHLRSESGDAWLRSVGRGRLALRRPGDRAAQRLLAGIEKDPHRHRPVLDQQECAGRFADHRRCRPGHGGDDRGLAAAPGRDAGAAANGGGRSRSGARATACATTAAAAT